MKLIKSHLFLFLLIFLGGCTKKQPLKIVISPTNVNGVIQINNDAETILSENVNKDGGTFEIKAPEAGFYELNVFRTGEDDLPVTYVYLDGAEIHIKIRNSGHPVVSSNSTIQKDIADYYTMVDNGQKMLYAAYNAAKDSLSARIDLPQVTGAELHVLTTNLSRARADYSKAEKNITRRFIESNPGSIFSAFLLDNISPDELSRDQVYYRALFDKLDEAAKGSSYGKKVDARIQENMKAAVGTVLPPITGKTIDGRPFNTREIKGKLTLIAFWRSLNKDSARDMIELKDLYRKHHEDGLEILAISFDKTPKRWKTFVQANDLKWINICDFKGASSANLKNFNTDRLPFYFLVGHDLKLKARDLQLSELPIYLKEYLTRNTGTGSGK